MPSIVCKSVLKGKLQKNKGIILYSLFLLFPKVQRWLSGSALSCHAELPSSNPDIDVNFYPQLIWCMGEKVEKKLRGITKPYY